MNKKLELNKLELNKGFFDKEKFKRIDNQAIIGKYYYTKVIGNYLIAFKHIGNDKKVLSANVCRCDLYIHINANIAGFPLNKMPVVFRSLTVSKIGEEYEKIKDFLNLEESKIITKK